MKTSRDCLSGTYEITGRLIFVEQSGESKCFVSEFLSYSQSLPSIVFDHHLSLVIEFVYMR